MLRCATPPAARLLILAVTSVLLALTALYSPSAHAAGDDPLRMRIATYNIHHGAGPDDILDLRHVMKSLAAMRADVIGLQEVDNHWSERSDFTDQAAWLGRELGMHVVYGANLDLDPAQPGEERRQYGTALLSRHPILSWKNTHLPRFGDHEQRGLLVAELKVRGVPVRVATTHLQHNDNLEREAQAAAIVDLLGEGPQRTILTGDLNAVPEAPEIKTLTGALPDTWSGEGDGFTIPVYEPARRIDYVLASPDVLVRETRVPWTDASDHLPVVADLSVPSA